MAPQSLRRRGHPEEGPEQMGTAGGFTTDEDTLAGRHGQAVKASLHTGGGRRPLLRAKLEKMAVRAIFGTVMMSIFAGIIYLGHAYICCLVFSLQCFVFSELVGVRKKQAAERHLPLFRSIQWAWFMVANFWTWSGHIAEFLGQSPTRIDALSAAARFLLDYSMMLSFGMYVILLIVSVLSLRKGLYKYQLSQYTWTLVTISIVVLQTQAAFRIIYEGLFWFVLPTSLVICNDIMAYFCGQLLGRRIIKRRFLEVSPNKTWEGFLGSAVCTVVFAWWFARFLSELDSMVCAPDDITFAASQLSCTPSEMFRAQPLWEIGEQLLPDSLHKAAGLVGSIAPEMSTRLLETDVQVCQLHAVLLGAFASFVAPFGGFLASAIKRAYGLKDFNNLIPGHGGMMDRFDCMFLMIMCTHVHIRTFCQARVPLEVMVGMAFKLDVEQQWELIRQLQEYVNKSAGVA